jgi:acyl dehydratase
MPGASDREMAELRVTPDRYLPVRYAGASGDFNPIHVDPEFARSVGLPDAILHGLYMMGLVARAAGEFGDGDPRRLASLSVQFRGMGFPEQEITVTGTVTGEDEGEVELDLVATQDGREVIRNSSARIRF